MARFSALLLGAVAMLLAACGDATGETPSPTTGTPRPLPTLSPTASALLAWQARDANTLTLTDLDGLEHRTSIPAVTSGGGHYVISNRLVVFVPDVPGGTITAYQPSGTVVVTAHPRPASTVVTAVVSPDQKSVAWVERVDQVGTGTTDALHIQTGNGPEVTLPTLHNDRAMTFPALVAWTTAGLVVTGDDAAGPGSHRFTALSYSPPTQLLDPKTGRELAVLESAGQFNSAGASGATLFTFTAATSPQHIPLARVVPPRSAAGTPPSPPSPLSAPSGTPISSVPVDLPFTLATGGSAGDGALAPDGQTASITVASSAGVSTQVVGTKTKPVVAVTIPGDCLGFTDPSTLVVQAVEASTGSVTATEYTATGAAERHVSLAAPREVIGLIPPATGGGGLSPL